MFAYILHTLLFVSKLISFYRLKAAVGLLQRCLRQLSSSRWAAETSEWKGTWTEGWEPPNKNVTVSIVECELHRNVAGSREDCRKTKKLPKQCWAVSKTVDKLLFRLSESNFRNVGVVVVEKAPFSKTFFLLHQLCNFYRCCLKDDRTSSSVQSRFWAAEEKSPLFCLPCWTTLQRPGWLKRSWPTHAIEFQTNFNFFWFSTF